MTENPARGRRQAVLRLAFLAALVAAATAVALLVPLPPPAEIRSGAAATGWWGRGLFILAYAALTLAPVPKNVLSVGAGLAFGLAGGVAVVFVAAMLGAATAFWLGRSLGREAVEKLTGARVAAVDGILRRRGLAAVIAVRLVPVLPFTAINYSAGLTAVRWWPYFLGTAIGILPGTTSYVALGAFGLEPGWGTGLALAVLALLTLAGTAAAVRRKRKGSGV